MDNLERNTGLTRPNKETKTTVEDSFIRLTPPVDVYESESELLLIADVPGTRQDTIEVRLEPPRLTIEARQSRHADDAHGTPAVRFERTFRVPDGLDPEGVEAKLERGVLKIHLKKSERLKPKRIEVRSS